MVKCIDGKNVGDLEMLTPRGRVVFLGDAIYALVLLNSSAYLFIVIYLDFSHSFLITVTEYLSKALTHKRLEVYYAITLKIQCIISI